MGSRERKRVERRKRKRRSTERVTTTVDETPAQPANDGAEAQAETESFSERMARRSEERNAEARAKLQPLEQGERPTAVTVAIFSSAEINGSEPSPFPLALFAGVLWLMAWGMWKARYWAVLGFQMLLVLFMLASALGIVGATTIFEGIGTLLALAGSGVLFYFLIRSMARIQMPERPQSR